MLVKKIFILILSFLMMTACQEEKTDHFQAIQAVEEKNEEGKLEVEIVDYCFSGADDRLNIYAFNRNLRLGNNRLILDTDGDGVSDREETLKENILNISYQSSDTNNDAYSDLIVYRAGYTENEQRKLHRCPNLVDTDKDGLIDCVEELLGTNKELFDSDEDGLPDLLEIRFSLNPLLKDGFLDTDMDGVKNFVEVQKGTPLRGHNEDATGFIKEHQIKYNLESVENSDRPDERCYHYEITNIPLNDKIADNIIELNLIEKIKGKSVINRYQIRVALSEENKRIKIKHEELEALGSE